MPAINTDMNTTYTRQRHTYGEMSGYAKKAGGNVREGKVSGGMSYTREFPSLSLSLGPPWVRAYIVAAVYDRRCQQQLRPAQCNYLQQRDYASTTHGGTGGSRQQQQQVVLLL